MNDRPRERYRTVWSDTARWEGFAFRDGDIIISTPPKCGTTWAQMICALLVFQTVELPAPLDVLSPWFEQLTVGRDELFAHLARQEHRRFIKSHTPLEGLPFDERVTYICVARDPRDVFVSFDLHLQNIDFNAFLKLREAAVGLDDMSEFPDAPAEQPTTERERFWRWVDDPDPRRGLAGLLAHLAGFWAVRDQPNVLLLHYGELKTDLVGEMRRLAGRLGLEVGADVLPELAAAASFDRMRAEPARFAPNATKSIWRDVGRFFRGGENGQWRRLLDGSDIDRYARRVAELAVPDLSDWVHAGPIRW